MNFIENMPLFF